MSVGFSLPLQEFSGKEKLREINQCASLLVYDSSRVHQDSMLFAKRDLLFRLVTYRTNRTQDIEQHMYDKKVRNSSVDS